MIQSPFQIVYEHAIAKAPQLAPRNTHIIHQWIASGFDPKLDIVPAIDECLKRYSQTVHSFAYFDSAVRKHHEQRIKAASQRSELNEDDREAAICQRLAFRARRMRQFLDTHDERRLAAYEAQHGEITFTAPGASNLCLPTTPNRDSKEMPPEP